jgi:hypothetical protein
LPSPAGGKIKREQAQRDPRAERGTDERKMKTSGDHSPLDSGAQHGTDAHKMKNER